MLGRPAQPFGGYEFEATRARAAEAVVDAVVGALGVTREILTGAARADGAVAESAREDAGASSARPNRACSAAARAAR
jgi:hypothetical protein